MKNEKLILPPLSNPDLQTSILQLLKLAVELYKPARIIIFGSQARGDWRADSDLDLLIIEPEVTQKMGALNVEAFKRKIRIRFDAVVALNKTLEEGIKDPLSVYSLAIKEGIEVYRK